MLLTKLPLRRFRDLSGFMGHTLRIISQLKSTSGVLGYSFLGRFFQRRFWTLSVWEDEVALRAFVRQTPPSHGNESHAGQDGEDAIYSVENSWFPVSSDMVRSSQSTTRNPDVPIDFFHDRVDFAIQQRESERLLYIYCIHVVSGRSQPDSSISFSLHQSRSASSSRCVSKSYHLCKSPLGSRKSLNLPYAPRLRNICRTSS